jgi:hypothetical protein
VADVIKAAFDVSLQYPLGRVRPSQQDEAFFNRIRRRVSGERETVYFWRLGMHFFFGGSSSH